MSECVRYLVSGKVQGVYFRASAAQEAQQLGLRGWVRNLPDGRVEALACGDAITLEQFRAWLWQGPKWARVENVEQSPEKFTVAMHEFSVR